MFSVYKEAPCTTVSEGELTTVWTHTNHSCPVSLSRLSLMCVCMFPHIYTHLPSFGSNRSSLSSWSLDRIHEKHAMTKCSKDALINCMASYSETCLIESPLSEQCIYSCIYTINSMHADAWWICYRNHIVYVHVCIYNILTPCMLHVAAKLTGCPSGPDNPTTPFSPVSPRPPSGPTSPIGPCLPLFPDFPWLPDTPCGPTAPAAPLTPVGPLNPAGPPRPYGIIPLWCVTLSAWGNSYLGGKYNFWVRHTMWKRSLLATTWNLKCTNWAIQTKVPSYELKL